MNNYLKEIIAYDKEKNAVSTESVQLISDKGIPGDRHFDDDSDQITILLEEREHLDDINDRKHAEDIKGDGLCTKRFKANLIVSMGNDVDNLRSKDVGDTLKVGKATLEITRKKGCHKECSLHLTGGNCDLKDCTYFAVVNRGGYITRKDPVE